MRKAEEGEDELMPEEKRFENKIKEFLKAQGCWFVKYPDWNWVQYEYRIKEEPKKRRMTNKELARWCAEGNGQYMDEDVLDADTNYAYADGCDDRNVPSSILIRGWNETEWREPLMEEK